EEIAKTFKFTNNNTVDWSKYTQDQLLSMVKKEPWYAEQTYYKGLVNNFLILDQGTAPYPRQLIIYDLTAKKEVLFDAYSVPLDITSNAVAYWNVTNQKITAENCPDSVQWIKEGLGAEIESHVSFDFLTLKPKELGQTRCRPTQ
ncbi:MAG: hypothetical protein NTV36_02275, partial [Candidatus Staskawiczbacteria bacterium]|nr:hypothetical protein [Candidatus Staskawiczbacteria bacterium]